MFVALLPIIQAIAALCTIWGTFHVSSTAETVVTYGAAEPTMSEWMNSFGSLGIGFITFIGSELMRRKYVNELTLAVLGWTMQPTSSAAVRRLGFAIVDWLESTFVSTKLEDASATWWKDTAKHIRTQILNDASTVTKP